MVIECTLHTILSLRIKYFFNPKGKGYNISVIKYMCWIGLGVGVYKKNLMANEIAIFGGLIFLLLS